MSNKVIWVEDDRFALQLGKRIFEATGLQVIPVNRAEDLWKSLATHSDIGVVILDIMMAPGRLPPLDVMAGFETGLHLAERIKTDYPHIKIIFYSASESDGRFDNQRCRLFSKRDISFKELAHEVKTIVGGSNRQPRSFIVHGHNETLLLDLKNYLQNTLKIPEPIILREQPACGRTIIEKFEEETQQIDLVFVLLTPDDITSVATAPNDQKRMARQNVIFEMGYFFGVLRRKKGRVLLLHKGPCELPSDISGIVYIDVSNGVEAAGELIRKELKAALHWRDS